MAGFKKWIRGKLGSKAKGTVKREQLPRHHESLPYLPPTRPRPLTPEPAHGNEESDPLRLLQNYGLFGHAPYEIRRQILVEAFGGRTLHMDIAYRYPFARKPRNMNAETSGSGPNASGVHRHCDLGSELAPDASRPQAWQWFSCVCHRRAGYSEIEKEQRYASCQGWQHALTIEPCDDECLEGSESMCSCQVERSDGDDGAVCFVGAMGWLLACRLA